MSFRPFIIFGIKALLCTLFKIQFQEKILCGCIFKQALRCKRNQQLILISSDSKEFSMTEKMMLDCKPTYNQSIFNGPRLSPLWDGGPPVWNHHICTLDLPWKTSINFDHLAVVISLSHH